jgi:hypothetical protein
LKKISIVSNTLPTQEFAFLELLYQMFKVLTMKFIRRIAYGSLKLTNDDFRSQLSEEIIKEKHPEVR